MALLTTFFIREKDVLLNEWIVTKINATGNSAMLSYLERIAAIKVTLTPARLYRIKEILYSSLRNYPRKSVQKMLEERKRSGSKKIKTICTNILMDRV